jgi:hypothetical protein
VFRLKTPARSVARTVRNRFEGANAADVDAFAEMALVVAYRNRTASDDEAISALISEQFAKDVESGVEYAVNLTNLRVDKVLRPAFQEAVSLGVDPVTTLVVKAGVTIDEAAEIVAKLSAETDTADEPQTSVSAIDAADDDYPAADAA